MADKSVGELVAAQSVTPTDLFVLEQNGTAKKLTGQILENWLVSFADGHGGIQSIAKLGTSGLADTYRITLADTTTFDFVVTNGRGVSSLRKTGTSGLVDTYTFTYNDGTKATFTVTNGQKGDKGDNAYIWVKYASQEPTAPSNSFGDIPDDWMGIYFGTASTAPTNWQSYKWYQIKGEKGDTGAPATLVSAKITYRVGDSGTIIPSGSWSSSVPPVTPGQYLWTRQVLQFNTGNPVTSYSVSRFGIDGTGAVSTVAGVAPDASGNVPLEASSVKALPTAGGTMQGPINMNGQPIIGLNAPTEDNEAVNKGYADSRNPENRIHNGDFTQWVAQAGISGKHGNYTYAGDRWILDSGTVTGDANPNGNGYSNIRLNGTIRQIIANPPAEGTIFVEMVSGTATAVYENGAVTITSAGGVIKNADLFEGVYIESNRPAHRSRGYSAELAECFRCHVGFKSVDMSFSGKITSAGDEVEFYLAVPTQMRVIPSLVLESGWISYAYHPTTGSYKSVTDIYTFKGNGPAVCCKAKLDESFGAAYMAVSMRMYGSFYFNADYPEEG